METTPTKPRETNIIRLKRIAPPTESAAPKASPVPSQTSTLSPPQQTSPDCPPESQLSAKAAAQTSVAAKKESDTAEGQPASICPASPPLASKADVVTIAPTPAATTAAVATSPVAPTSSKRKRAKATSIPNPEDDAADPQKKAAKPKGSGLTTSGPVSSGGLTSASVSAGGLPQISTGIPTEVEEGGASSRKDGLASPIHLVWDDYLNQTQPNSTNSIPLVSISSLPINHQTIGCIYSDYSPDSGVSSDGEPIFETAERPEFLTVEPCRIQGYKLTLPVSFIGLSDYSAIFSMEIWKKVLNEKERGFLQKLLPEGMDCDIMVDEVFSGRNIGFDSPIARFTNDLKDGVYHRRVSKYRKRIETMERNLHLEKLRDFHDQNVLLSMEYARKLQNPPEYDDFDYYARLVSQCNEEIQETHKLEELKEQLAHEKSVKAQMVQNMESRLNQSIEAINYIPSFHNPIPYGYINSSDEVEEETPCTTINPMSLCENHEEFAGNSSQTKRASKMPSTANLRKAKLFNLLKDETSEKPLTTPEIEHVIAMRYQNVFRKMHDALSAPVLADMMLKFLSSSTSGEGFPIIQQVYGGRWRWTVPDISAARMKTIWDSFIENIVTPSLRHAPSKRTYLRSVLTIIPTDDDTKAEFHRQELIRHQTPYDPFEYVLNGRRCVVGPVPISKSRHVPRMNETTIFVSSRPPSVSIKSLVRDALSRLPTGEGTRADICSLVRDSQFIVPNTTENRLVSIVNAALDRLHYEKDPCVRYDGNRQRWIYTHFGRTLDDFASIDMDSRQASDDVCPCVNSMLIL